MRSVFEMTNYKKQGHDPDITCSSTRFALTGKLPTPGPPVELINGVNSGNLAAVAPVKALAKANESKFRVNFFMLLFVSFLFLATNVNANNGGVITTAGGGDLQGGIKYDAPNSTIVARAIGSLNDTVTKNYLRTRTVESKNVGINSSPENINHGTINNTRSKTKVDIDTLVLSEEKKYADEDKENSREGLRDLVSYNIYTILYYSLCFCP